MFWFSILIQFQNKKSRRSHLSSSQVNPSLWHKIVTLDLSTYYLSYFVIGTLLNGCNPEIPECGFSSRRIVSGVDAAPGQWPWAAIVGTPIITTVGSEPGIQGWLKTLITNLIIWTPGCRITAGFFRFHSIMSPRLQTHAEPRNLPELYNLGYKGSVQSNLLTDSSKNLTCMVHTT